MSLHRKEEQKMNQLLCERNRNKIFILYLCISLILLFQDILQQYFLIFKWSDEVIGVVLLPITFLLFYTNSATFYKEEKIIIVASILLVIVGLCSSFINKYQSNSAVIADLIITIKFLGAYFFARSFFNKLVLRDYFKYIKITFRIITALIFIVTILDIVLNIFPKSDKRFFIYSEKLLFFHPMYLGLFCMVVLVYLTLVSDDKPIDYLFMGQIVLVCISSMRAKAIGILVVFFLLAVFLRKGNIIKPSYIISVLLILTLVFIPQLDKYYIKDQDSPRAALTRTSFEIAGRFFPLGAGFGTYGSYISSEYYSPLYYEYRLNEIWGLEETNISFITDTFWPVILGQFGYIGLALFIVIVSCFALLIKRLLVLNKKYFFFAAIPFLYILIASTAETSFFNYYSPHFFILIGITINQINIKINADINAKKAEIKSAIQYAELEV